MIELDNDEQIDPLGTLADFLELVFLFHQESFIIQLCLKEKEGTLVERKGTLGGIP